MKIIWDKVTHLSQLIAIILFVGVFFLGMMLGRLYERPVILGKTVATASFVCAGGKTINAEFFDRYVRLEFGGRPTIYLPQAISASGARYADKDEYTVFWNKGDTAFMSEGSADNITFKDCMAKK